MTENTFSIFDVSEDAEVRLMINDPGRKETSGIWTVRLLKDSAFRRLLEDQQVFQDSFDAAKKAAGE